jgi:ATP-dependent DNA ligase
LAGIGRDIGHPAVLDGETVVLGPDGHPDFGLLSARLHRGRRLRVVAAPPATFVAFDVLELDGQPTTDLPWTARRDLLVGLGFDGVKAVPTMVCDDGDALFAATDRLGVEGVVAKRRHSHYVCGRRSASWLKLKHRQTGWYDVTGWRLATPRQPAGGITLADTDDGRHAGTALDCLPGPQAAVLHEFIRRHGIRAGDTVHVPASAQVRVDHLEQTPTGLLREALARELRATPT